MATPRVYTSTANNNPTSFDKTDTIMIMINITAPITLVIINISCNVKQTTLSAD